MIDKIAEAYLTQGVMGLFSITLIVALYVLWTKYHKLNDEMKAHLKNESIENAKNAVALSNALNHVVEVVNKLPTELREKLDPKFNEIKLNISEVLRNRKE